MIFYNLRNNLNYLYFNYRTKDIFKTKPVESFFDNPDGSIHSMLCERDLQLYLLSIKSFLSRIKNIKLAVFVHSDGSLSEKSIELLKYHIKGLKIITKADARLFAQKKLSEKAMKIRDYGGTFDRLIDSILWSQGNYHIQMDSDILTTANPEYINRWCNSGMFPFVISDLRKSMPELSKVDYDNAHIQTQCECRQNEISNVFGEEFKDTQGLCSGFYGWRNGDLKVEDIEKFVNVCEKFDLNMKKWGAEQVTTTWLLSLKNAERLPQKEYINLNKDTFSLIDSAKIIHFIGSYRFKNNWYIKKSLSEISRLNKS
ncbi:MAG: hypothetical protein ACQEQF_10435 [Bacillota bacterium]